MKLSLLIAVAVGVTFATAEAKPVEMRLKSGVAYLAETLSVGAPDRPTVIEGGWQNNRPSEPHPVYRYVGRRGQVPRGRRRRCV